MNTRLIRRLATTCLFSAALPALASGPLRYEVSITNLTKAQTFTPQLIATHAHSVHLFTPGQPATEALEILAEGGDTAPLTDALEALGGRVGDVATAAGLLLPGESRSIVIQASPSHRHLSVAAMLIPTNDTFFAIDAMTLPRSGTQSEFATAWDAGTEANDQSCTNIPGPRCGGAGHSPGPNEADEGYIYVSNGFHELGTDDGAGGEVLRPPEYDWHNPVARVTVKRVH